MTPRRTLLRALIGCALIVLWPAMVNAQNSQTGFGVNRFDPSERGSDWFVLDSLDFRGHLRLSAGVVGDYGLKPLVFYNADGSLRSSLIRDQLFVHVGGAIVLWERLRFALTSLFWPSLAAPAPRSWGPPSPPRTMPRSATSACRLTRDW